MVRRDSTSVPPTTGSLPTEEVFKTLEQLHVAAAELLSEQQLRALVSTSASMADLLRSHGEAIERIVSVIGPATRLPVELEVNLKQLAQAAEAARLSELLKR